MDEYVYGRYRRNRVSSEERRARAAHRRDPHPLTDRESEIVASVARGLSNAEVADELHVSVSTVKAHVASSMSKLGARNRVELVIWAYEHQLAG